MEPTIPKKDAEEIRRLISDGFLRDALEKIQSYGNYEFVLLKSRYEELHRYRRQSRITNEEFEVKQNQLKMDCLAAVEEYTIDEIEESEEMAEEKENNNPERDRMPPYLEGLELHPFAAGLEKLLLMEPEFFPTMDHYKGDKILTYYYLQEQQLNFRKALQRLSEVETNKNDFDERLIDIFKLLEKQGEQFSRALKKSGNNGIPLFAELERILKDINTARKELVRAIVAGHNSIEKSRLVDITLPQLEIGLEELIASIGKARDEIAHFSRN